MALNSLAAWVTAAGAEGEDLEQVLLRPSSIHQIIRCLAEADKASASNVLPPLIRMLHLKKLNRALGSSGMAGQVLKRLQHPEAVVRKGVLQVSS